MSAPAQRCTMTLGHSGPHKHDPKQVRGFLHGPDCGESVARNRRDRDADHPEEKAL